MRLLLGLQVVDSVSQTRDHHVVLENGATTVQCKALFKFLGQTKPHVKVMPKLLSNELPLLLSPFELVALSDPRHLKYVHPVKKQSLILEKNKERCERFECPRTLSGETWTHDLLLFPQL